MARKRQTHKKKKRGPNIRGRSGIDRGILRNAFWGKNADEVVKGGENEEEVVESHVQEEENFWGLLMRNYDLIMNEIERFLNYQEVDEEVEEEEEQQQQQNIINDPEAICPFCLEHSEHDMPLERVCNCKDGYHFECLCQQLTHLSNTTNRCSVCRQVFRHPNVNYTQTSHFSEFIRRARHVNARYAYIGWNVFCLMIGLLLFISCFLDEETSAYITTVPSYQRIIITLLTVILSGDLLNTIRNTPTRPFIDIQGYNPQTRQREPGFSYRFDRVIELRNQVGQARTELSDLIAQQQIIRNQLANQYGINYQHVNQQILNGLTEIQRHEVEVLIDNYNQLGNRRELLLLRFPQLNQIVNQLLQQLQQPVQDQQQQQ